MVVIETFPANSVMHYPIWNPHIWVIATLQDRLWEIDLDVQEKINPEDE